MITIGEAVSRLRTLIKSVKQDASLSDRFLHSLIVKHGKLLMRRQDNLNRVMKFNSVFQKLDFVELIDIDKVEASCRGLSSGCYIKRTKEKLPKMYEGYWGVLVRDVTSIDGTESLQHTYASTYEQISKQKYFKYNTKKYFWYIDGHMYFPNLPWDAIRIEAIFEEDISKYNCDVEDDCLLMQEKTLNIPEFLFSEIEQMALKELTVMLQIPTDTQHDQKNVVN